MTIPVVDVFAGPGGLGEGFSSFSTKGSGRKNPFRIAISAEMESNAARTLRLRAFFRNFDKGHAPKSYYDYIAGRCELPWTSRTEAEWRVAEQEALQLELGQQEHDEILHGRIRQVIRKEQPWILIGGPPCQAYSLVGRARNKGISSYRAENDSRHFLYQHYLRIIERHRPAAFVMENVKGILSSRVGGELMFPRILEDLSKPGGRNGARYRLVPLATSSAGLCSGFCPSDFIVRAETLGVPQARHRVILLGIRDDLSPNHISFLRPSNERFSVNDAIRGLPALRSGVTGGGTNDQITPSAVLALAAEACVDRPDVRQLLIALAGKSASGRRTKHGSGGRWLPKTVSSDDVPLHLRAWLVDRRLDGILNHEVRAHMIDDLKRYAYAAAFASIYGYSPRGTDEFPGALHPQHKNWGSGKFVDRFKVQLGRQPSSTITSHLSKDGHYFIHPDPVQTRSLSVREAARLQTFPDNYFFEGSRGAQFRQVGNAVPPWLAHQIAAAVYSAISL